MQHLMLFDIQNGSYITFTPRKHAALKVKD